LKIILHFFTLTHTKMKAKTVQVDHYVHHFGVMHFQFLPLYAPLSNIGLKSLKVAGIASELGRPK